MEDDDIQVTSDGEDAEDDAGGNAQVAGLPPYVDAIIQGYSRQYGRVIGRKLVRAKDPAKDRDRLVVTYEDGSGKRKAVTFKIGKEGTPADPSIKDDEGTPAETTIVESVEDAKTPPKPAARQTTVRGPDGKNHIMEADATGAYTIDRGLAPNQPPEEKPKPSEAVKWQPLTGPDGKVVALLDPSTGDTVAVSQKDPAKPEVFQTKDGRIITVSPDGATAKDVTPEGPEDKTFPAGLEYRPDYNDPDGGLAEYNELLLQARRDGRINRQQGLAALQQAGAIWEQHRGHGKELIDQQRQGYEAEVTDRNTTLGETASRRTAAGNNFNTAFQDYSAFAGKLPVGSGGIAADAFQAAMNMGRRNAEEWGGMRDEAPVEIPEALQAIRKVKIGKDGSVNIEIPDPTPQTPLTPADQAAQQQAAGAGGGQPTDAVPGAGGQNVKEDRGPAAPAKDAAPVPATNPAAGEPGHDPTQPVGIAPIPPVFEAARSAPPQWSPHPGTLAQLKADGYTQDEIDEVLGQMTAA